MILYGSDTSPYTRKVRVLIQEKRIDCQWVLERPADSGGRFRELNPLGKIPVLELGNGEVLFDSPVIAAYLDSLSGAGLIPGTGEARWQVLKMQALADGILDATVARLLEHRRPTDRRMQQVIDTQTLKIHDSLDFAEQWVTDRTYVVGEVFTLADVALAVALEYIDLRYAHDWRGARPVLAAWLAPVSERPSFVATRPPQD